MRRWQLLRTALVVSIVALVIAATFYVTAIGARPDGTGLQHRIAMEAGANHFLADSVFRSADGFDALKRALVGLADRHAITVYVAFDGRLAPGTQVAAAIEQGRSRAESYLAALPDGFNRRDALVLVLIENPMTFELLGLGSVRDRFALRGVSAKHGLRHLQLTYVLPEQQGRPLVEALKRIDTSLAPLNPFIRNLPVAPPGTLETLLDGLGGEVMTHAPTAYTTFLVQHARLYFEGTASQRLTTTAGLIAVVLIANFMISQAFSRLVAFVAERGLRPVSRQARGMAGRLLRGLVELMCDRVADFITILPVIGCFAVLAFGDLRAVIQLSQVTGEELASLVRMTREVNRSDLEVAWPLAVGLSFLYLFANVLTFVHGASSAPTPAAASARYGGLDVVLGLLAATVLAWLMLAFTMLFSLEGSLGSLLRIVLASQAVVTIAWILWRAGR